MEWLKEIHVDARSPLPILHQLKEAFKRVMVAGLVGQGEKLPSIRFLAAHFRVHPNTMAKVYSHLELEGYIYTRAGTGAFVQVNPEGHLEDKEQRLTELCRDLWQKVRQLDYGMEALVSRLEEVSQEQGAKDD